ncbi:MAG: hypothetical protein ACI92O_002380 [Colwellia sp.]|jgi:hypothetical protein
MSNVGLLLLWSYPIIKVHELVNLNFLRIETLAIGHSLGQPLSNNRH